MSDRAEPITRTRREPPRFRPLAVRRVERVTPRLVRVTLAGPGLDGLTEASPAASVRLLLPSPGSPDLVAPVWTGNEWLLPDGRRPAIRTFTPWRADSPAGELDLGIVIHGAGLASGWAAGLQGGEPAAVSGPGRGYAIDPDAPGCLLAGDESAIPAITQLLEALPTATAVRVHIEIADPLARLPLPDHPGTVVEWHELPAGGSPGDTLVAAVAGADLAPDWRVWVAGEAASVQRIRRHLFEDQGWPRALVNVRGYWKHGRPGDDG